MSAITLVFLVGGLVVLTLGADLLVRGASSLALVIGISPLVVGLTVVAYGTSTPELAVSISAGLRGNADIAVANVIGSNIFNILFILGACALIVPLAVNKQLIKFDVPLMIGATLLGTILGLDGNYGFGDGIVLMTGIVIYTGYSVWKSRRDSQAERAAINSTVLASTVLADTKPSLQKIAKDIGLMIAGLTFLAVGSNWFVGGAAEIAKFFGVSDTVIGLTIVAIGTSLPEVATSIVATMKGQREIAIGNVIGSNMYNVLGILGLAAIVTPGGLNVEPSTIAVDLPVMLGVALISYPVFLTRSSIDRWEGALFMICYVAYTAYLILAASHSAHLGSFVSFVTWGLIPAAVGAIVFSLVAGMRSNGRVAG